MTVTLLDPTGERGSVERPRAPRPAALDGQIVALLDITKPRVPTPQDLTDVLGTTNFFSVKGTMIHDTRDSTFLPTQGHYIELGFEQAFGDFVFPRMNLDMRQHFVLHERPDTSGRHVLSLIGRFGVSGEDTPLYERFFAGGFSTLRGFEFRGASPVDLPTGVVVGGEMQALGSVEYLFPITADDMLRGVTFVDFGTVERTANFNGQKPVIDPGDAVLLLIGHQSGLFQTVKEVRI